MLTPGGFAVNPETQQLFVDAPEDKPSSRLEPYREQILLWRKRGKSYRRICRVLNERCNCIVSHVALRKFVQRRSRPRKGQPEVQADEPIAVAPVIAPLEQAATPRLSLEERIAQRDAIRAAHNKPSVKREETERVFEFDEANYIPVNKNYNT
jgi:hypothetical protein